MREVNGESYKPLPEKDMDEDAVRRPRSLVKSKSCEIDPAEEEMLADEMRRIQDSSVMHIDDKQNGDAKLNIGEQKNVFGGMDKEELLKYAKDPFWVRLRWFLFITFWLCWAAMLVGAIMIIYEAPKCEPPAPRTWWQQGPLSEIDPTIAPEKLKFLDKGIKGVILILHEDSYKKLDESHIVLKLIKQATDLQIKTIIDLDPTSSNEWFTKSEDKVVGNYSEYYIWRKPKNGTQPPNNWKSKNNKSSWKLSNKRNQYFYSPLEKPLLNFSNTNVIAEFGNVIKYFVSKGISGIRLRNVPYILVDPSFEDEDIASTPGFNLVDYKFYTHFKTENRPEIGRLLKVWKDIVRNLTTDGPLMVTDELTKLESYKVDNKVVVDLPLKTHIFEKSNVSFIVNNLNHTYNIDNIEWPLWKVNSTVFPQDVLDIITYLLKGTTLVNNNVTIDPDLLKTRDSPAVMRGDCSLHSINNNTVFAFIRVKSGNPGILVVVNAIEEKVVASIPKEIPVLADLEEVTVQMYSKNYNETIFMGKGEKKNAAEVPISPKSAIVLSFVPPKNN